LTRPGPAGHYRATRVLPDNLGYLFDTALAISPSNPAVFQGETVPTYADLDARSNRCGSGFWGGQRPSLADYVRCGGHEGATAAERA